MVKKVIRYITHWEDWHWLAKYIPIMPSWCWYCIKSRSVWFFTPSNPTLTFGGFLGETKKEMYSQLPESTFPKSVYIKSSQGFNEVKNKFHLGNYSYPVAVKPDVGMKGFLFRKIDSEEKLKRYHQVISVDYIIQDYIDYPLEVSVFYYRYPGEEKGTISGFLKKEYLQVIGDGTSTLWELIKRYDRVSFRLEEMKKKHHDRLSEVIARDEIVCLSPALNLSRGGKLISLDVEKDEKLLKVFDDLSHYTNSFYYGRYDVKCKSIEDLKEGRNFSILEYNGSGAEPHHIYGNGNSLFRAYSILLQHWKVLYKISKLNNENGVPYWNFLKGIKYTMWVRRYFKMLSQLDAQVQL